MKIGIISEAPVLTTGFGIVCSHIAQGLSEAGYDVVCFGIGVTGETFNRQSYPYRIWSVGTDNLIPKLSEFLQYEAPDLLLICFDLIAVGQWVNYSQAVGWDGLTISYFVMDGLPIDAEYLNVLRKLDGAVTATNVVKDYLMTQGLTQVRVAPHGVDHSIFYPKDKNRLKTQAGLGDKFIIGMFGRNNERKQHPRLLMALSHLKASGNADDILLYFHCQSIDDAGLRGWDLKWLAKELGVLDEVLFPDDSYNQLMGTPLDDRELTLKTRNNDAPSILSYSYPDRIRCCDLIVNVSYCGGFELGLIEAQACGIPIAVTNDDGILAEVVGQCAFMLTPNNQGFWTTGAKQFWVSHDDLASAILQIKNNKDLQKEISLNGIENAKKYCWSDLHEVLASMIHELLD